MTDRGFSAGVEPKAVVESAVGDAEPYGVPFSHLFTELQISSIDLHISPIELQISPNEL